MKRDLAATQKKAREKESELAIVHKKMSAMKEETGAIRSLRDRLQVQLSDAKRELQQAGDQIRKLEVLAEENARRPPNEECGTQTYVRTNEQARSKKSSRLSAVKESVSTD